MHLLEHLGRGCGMRWRAPPSKSPPAAPQMALSLSSNTAHLVTCKRLTVEEFMTKQAPYNRPQWEIGLSRLKGRQGSASCQPAPEEGLPGLQLLPH